MFFYNPDVDFEESGFGTKASSDFLKFTSMLLRAILREPVRFFYLYIGITLSGYIVAQGFDFCNMEYCTK